MVAGESNVIPMPLEVAAAVAAKPARELTSLELRAMAASILAERAQIARLQGVTFDGKRDLYAAFGYQRALTASDFRERFERGGVAGRIVEALPKATWRGGVSLVDDEDPETETPLEKAWEAMKRALALEAKLLRADTLSRLSTFSVLLIGAPGELSTPLPKSNGKGPLFFQAYMGHGGPNMSVDLSRASGRGTTTYADAGIEAWDTDAASKRFGKPLSYKLRRQDFSAPAFDKSVHWTRVIHLCEEALDDEVFGRPALLRVWNLLDDLDKVTGGGAEAFFQRANQGRVWSMDKDTIGLDENDLNQFRDQIERFQHGLTRDVRLKGVTVQPLGSDVAQFGPNSEAILTQIAGSTGIPKRILTGSEMGELASSQDRENWRDQVTGRREQHAEPFVVRQLVDRLVDYGYLPPPKDAEKGYGVEWGTVLELTSEERQAGAQAWANTKTDEGPVFTNAEIRDHWYGMAPVDDEQRKEIAKRKTEDNELQAELDAAYNEATAASDPQLAAAASGTDPFALEAIRVALESGDEELALEALAEVMAEGGVQ